MVVLVVIYIIRHFLFTMNRIYGEQRMFYQDIIDSEYPTLSVLIPMYNEEKVAANILNLLVRADYPRDRLDIIPINDHSNDGTRKILDKYAAEYPFIRPIHRTGGRRGKPSALNDALAVSTAEIILVFDADYLPSRGILKDLAVCFQNPEIGAVMGRVIPVNTSRNLLTRILDIERSGGYQVDQQARYNLKLITQYGGTVGGFRRKTVLELGGFNPETLTEDTELTYRLYLNGWKVVYANRAECYEEVPETWEVRARQIRRWSRGHNQVLFHYLFPMLKSDRLDWKEKVDGTLLLFVYVVSFVLILGMADSLVLFFLGEMQIIVSSALVMLFTIGYSTFGNYAPFYQLGLAAFLDGSTYRIRLLPLLLFNFLFNIYYTSLGFIDALIDLITRRRTVWHKTERFRESQA